MATWKTRHARARLSELIEHAVSDGPQTITRRGTERAVVLSVSDYRAMLARTPTLKDLLLGGPKVDDFTIVREQDAGQDDPA